MVNLLNKEGPASKRPTSAEGPAGMWSIRPARVPAPWGNADDRRPGSASRLRPPRGRDAWMNAEQLAQRYVRTFSHPQALNRTLGRILGPSWVAYLGPPPMRGQSSAVNPKTR